MDEIIVTAAHISWKKEILKKNVFCTVAVITTLEKPFNLTNNLFVPMHFTELMFGIEKVETKTDIYELDETMQIKKINKISKKENIVEEILTFKAYKHTKIIQTFMEMRIFGFDDIRRNVTSYIDFKRSMIITLHGPDGCGKGLFMKQLELKSPHKLFIFIDGMRLREKKEIYLKKLVLGVETLEKNVVICIEDAHMLEACLKDDDSMYTVLDNFMKNDNLEVKVIISCLEEKLLNPNIVEITTKSFLVYPLNNEEKSDYVKFLISKICNIERNDQGLNIFAKTLLGYTPRDIKKFLTKLAKRHPELTLEQLQEARKNKDYIPNHLLKMIADVEGLRWSDIGGYEDVKEKMRDSIQTPLLKDRDIDAGVLLYGPPGCSKTMFVRALATECGLSLFTVTPSNIMSCFVGESESRLRRIINHAYASAPSIIFIDEIDMLIPKRGSMRDSSVTDKLLNELLVMTDGVDSKRSKPRVILVAATNRLDNLDEALVRPGRMDLKIEIGLPDQISREEILKIVFSDSDFNVSDYCFRKISEIAQSLVDKSGAEIVDIGKEIKREARRSCDDNSKEHPTVTMDHVSRVLKKL